MANKDTKDVGKSKEAATGVKTAAKTASGANEASKDLRPVEELAAMASVKEWELAGLMRAAGWAAGKECSPALFARALTAFRSRPQGGGRIAI